MRKEDLINEIAYFCYEYRLFSKTIEVDEIKNKIERQLNESDFLESLINTIIVKTKNHKNMSVEKLKDLLLELEKLRLEIEYQEK